MISPFHLCPLSLSSPIPMVNKSFFHDGRQNCSVCLNFSLSRRSNKEIFGPFEHAKFMSEVEHTQLERNSEGGKSLVARKESDDSKSVIFAHNFMIKLSFREKSKPS